jgi:hypothetical protein
MSVLEAHLTYQGLNLDGLERLVSVETVSILSGWWVTVSQTLWKP